jgi:hypothetical protein
MNRQIRDGVLFKIVILLVFLGIGSVKNAVAQNLRQVEIEVAGPWDYVVDPSDSNRIIVITPSINHDMDVLAGGNANAFARALDPGVYSLKFQLANCAVHGPVSAARLLDVTTDASPNAVSNALGATGKRFAVSLPRPCYYETYLDSYAKVSTNPIDFRTQEASYTIWMSLHYTVQDTTTAIFDGNSDSSGPIKAESLMFANSPWPPTANAISLVAYYGNAGENYGCDQHSADHFDAALVSLWGQKALYRLFPELDATGKQTHRYNYDPAICAQSNGQSQHSQSDDSANGLLRRIVAIRDDLTGQNLPDAKIKLESLRKSIFELWNKLPPPEVQEDLKSSALLLNQLIESHRSLPPDWASLFLKVTELSRAPGRADCHVMQFNVNNAVP